MKTKAKKKFLKKAVSETSFYDRNMNVVYMEYFILKSPVVIYKNMALVKNDHELSVHHVKLLNDCTMKITFIDISVVWLQRYFL